MLNKKNTRHALVERTLKEADQPSFSSIYESCREEFEKSALIHFNKHPFDYEMAKLPDHNKRKQRFVFSEAFFALVDAWNTHNPSRGSIETWVSRKIEWRFKGLCKKRYDANEAQKAMRCYGGEGNVSLGGYVKYGNAIVWRQYDTDNHEQASPKISDVEMMKTVLESVPSQCSAHKILTTWIQERAKNQGDVAQKLNITQQAVSKALKKVKKKIADRRQVEFLESLRE
ncbi:hypothetical protein [Fibrobacter sp.]|uniref:hypothetical protein n=1 Tax=Fibrobacter sp. TaxID=35828 RepID=UPI00388F62B5